MLLGRSVVFETVSWCSVVVLGRPVVFRSRPFRGGPNLSVRPGCIVPYRCSSSLFIAVVPERCYGPFYGTVLRWISLPSGARFPIRQKHKLIPYPWLAGRATTRLPSTSDTPNDNRQTARLANLGASDTFFIRPPSGYGPTITTPLPVGASPILS